MKRWTLLSLMAAASLVACATGGGDPSAEDSPSASSASGTSTGSGDTGSGDVTSSGTASGPATGSGGGMSSGTPSSSGSGVGGSSTAGSGGSGSGAMGGTGVGGSGAMGGAGGTMTTGGGGSGDLWIEITYTSNSTPTSPSWDNSATVGWPLQSWATSNETWPEVWDPLQGMSTSFDPMGYWAGIIDGEHLQLMIGLQDLVSYTDAVVRLEGRGYSTNSSAQIDVYNPLNNCGVSTSMAHDWSLHVVEVSLGSCMVPGGGVQAIRVAPTSQGLALHRMRLTIVDGGSQTKLALADNGMRGAT